jgi:hypothetical protein
MKKYLKYAIGEIFLVVIGILIAVNLNNWNEERKAKNRLKTIFKMVKADFVQDTLITDRAIQYYQKQDSLIYVLVSDTFNLDILKKNPKIRTIPFTNFPFKMTSTSIDLLRHERSNTKVAKDTLVKTLLGFYDSYNTNFQDIDQKLKADVANNTAFMKTFDNDALASFIDKRDSAYYSYFLSKDFKNRVIMHRQLTINLYTSAMKNFNQSVKNVIPYIDDRTAE